MAKRKPFTPSASGEELPGWGCTIRYVTERDVLEVTWWREDTLRRRGRSRVKKMPGTDVEDALAAVQVAARTLAATRLF